MVLFVLLRDCGYRSLLSKLYPPAKVVVLPDVWVSVLTCHLRVHVRVFVLARDDVRVFAAQQDVCVLTGSASPFPFCLSPTSCFHAGVTDTSART